MVCKRRGRDFLRLTSQHLWNSCWCVSHVTATANLHSCSAARVHSEIVLARLGLLRSLYNGAF